MQYYLWNYCHQLGFLCEKLYDPPSADTLSLSKSYALYMKALFNMLSLNLLITQWTIFEIDSPCFFSYQKYYTYVSSASQLYSM